MKKICSIILTICLMAGALCLPAFAADEPASDVVLRISALKTDGTTTVKIEDHTVFDDGWNAAMKLAQNSGRMQENGYDRIVVDLYSDWYAVDGQFTDDFDNGEGFDWDAINFKAGVKMTLNMNGHTIHRGDITKFESNGEVMHIDEKADVVINNGTISGGSSKNGAGGIHIDDDALVVLNNVNVVGNAVAGDDGAGIAVYDNATLIMNGGSISNNRFSLYAVPFTPIFIYPYGALYVNDSTVMLNNVTLSGNYTFEDNAQGVAIYATNSTVTMKECVVSDNAVETGSRTNAASVIAAYNSKLTITDTDFISNASKGKNDDALLFYLEDSSMTMTGGKITQNHASALFELEDSDAEIKGVTITDNASCVIYVDNDSEKVYMTECTLGSNTPYTDNAEVRVETKGTLTMTDCILGDTTFEDKGMVAGAASLLGEGSLTMIVAILALAAAVASTGISLAMYKKKTVPSSASNAEAGENR